MSDQDGPAGIEQAAKAGLWSTLDLLIRQGFQFVVSVVLARLLTPSDFGLIALLTFFTSLSIVFVQGGLATALIQRRDTSIEEESAVFWLNLLASVVFGAVLLAIAPGIARLYEQPLLAPLMGVAAAQIVLSALGAVQGSLLSRELRFDQLMKTGIASSFISGAAGIAAALAGWGVWALATQMIAAAAIGTATLWWVSDWRPILHFRPRTLRRLFAFGSWLSLSSTLDVLYTQGFALLLGKIYGVSELGLYNRASSTQLLPSNVLSLVIARVALPLFSARSGDPVAVRRGVRLAIGISMLLNLPLMLGLSLLARPVIGVLFGAQWLPAAPILSILALGGGLLPLHVINLQVLLAHGGSGRFFSIEAAKKLVGIVCIVVGSFFGILGLAWSQVIAGVLALWLNAAPMTRLIDYGAGRQLRDLAGLVVPLIAMGGAVEALKAFAPLSPILLLLTATVTGAVIYLAAGLVLRVRIFGEAIIVLRPLLTRRAGTSAGYRP